MPAFSELGALREQENLQEILVQGSKFSMAMGTALAVPFGFLAEPLIKQWVGEGYTWVTNVTVVLLLTMLLLSGYRTGSTLLLGLAKHRVLAMITLLAGGLNLVVVIPLVKSIGLMGVALGNLIAVGMVSFLLVNLYACRVIRLSFRRLVQKTIVPLFLPAFASGLLGWAFLRYQYPDSVWMLGIEAAGCALLFALAYFGGLNGRERVLLVREVRGLMQGGALE
jgi:O-antigen/teichoic acid export membrane protein